MASNGHSFDLPAYSGPSNGANGAAGQVYTLHSLDNAFTISIFAPSTGDHPIYTQNTEIKGKVTWNVAAKEEKIEALSISFRGVSRTAMQEENIVKENLTWLINAKETLWEANRNFQGLKTEKAGRLLPGTYEFPFTFRFPSKYREGETWTPLPPSYAVVVAGAPQRVRYWLEVEVDRAGLHWHKVLSKHKIIIVYLPSAIPNESNASLAFKKAREAGEFPPGPEADPGSWKVETREVKLKKSLKTQTLGRLDIELALPNDAPYHIGTSIPFILSIQATSSENDHLLNSLRIYIGRQVTNKVPTSVATMGRQALVEVLPARLKHIVVGDSARELDTSEMGFNARDGKKRFFGEFVLDPDAASICASFQTANLKCEWFVGAAFVLPGLSGMISKEHIEFPIELVGGKFSGRVNVAGLMADENQLEYVPSFRT
ncbi:hypothetical protein BT69DRAFT_1275940 [Atractiella rhizophila]|nr:hypothetical protein BT69DRAFT_1275940 [Atractiella rhizophila]